MSQTYAITNFDNISPTFVVSDRIDLVSNDNNSSSYSYIEVKDVVDEFSGIKYIKYERENITDTNSQDAVDDIAIYFKTNGINLNSDMIEIDENTKYITVYVEDNAGNYSCITKEV